jgi:ABC-type amino acid transport system permease subunit
MLTLVNTAVVGMFVPCRSASCWRWAAARTCRSSPDPLRAFIEFWRGVPLITVLFMANVMLPLFLPQGVELRQAAAGADRRHAVPVGLHGRGGPRRPAGDSQGAV